MKRARPFFCFADVLGMLTYWFGCVLLNQAVSRLRPLTIMCWRKTPSKVKPKRSAARRERALTASHFHSSRR